MPLRRKSFPVTLRPSLWASMDAFCSHSSVLKSHLFKPSINFTHDYSLEVRKKKNSVQVILNNLFMIMLLSQLIRARPLALLSTVRGLRPITTPEAPSPLAVMQDTLSRVPHLEHAKEGAGVGSIQPVQVLNRNDQPLLKLIHR